MVLKSWDSFSCEEILSTPIFSVSKEHVQCGRSGSKAFFYSFNFTDWVNVVAVTPDGLFVMIRQFRHGSGRVELEVPGGAIDSTDNSPEEAASRELLEETGYAGEDGVLIGKVCPNPALQGNWCYTVLIKSVVRVCEPEMEATEDIDTVLMSPEEVDQQIRDGELSHGLVLNALHFYNIFEK